MPENRHLRFLLFLFYILLGLTGAYIAVRYVLRWLLPFILAWPIAALLKAPEKHMVEHLHFSPGFTAVILCTGFYGLLFGLIALILSYLAVQLRAFLQSLPELAASASVTIGARLEDLTDLLRRLPDPISEPLLRLFDSMYRGLSSPSIGTDELLGAVKTVAVSIPELLVFLAALLVSTVYFVRDHEKISAFVFSRIPHRFGEGLRRLQMHLKETAFRWLRAAGILSLITFAELAAGLSLIRVDYAVLLAVFIALIDALPVLGTGSVLIPWALYLLLAGDPVRAAAILILYAVVTVVRQALEPRILGKHLGLHPLIMLICFYLGYRTLGFIGIFLFPLLILCLIKLREWGFLRLWYDKETLTEPEERE